MIEIKITVKGKVAVGDGTKIVCRNSDYVVKWDLDAEWNDLLTRTMRVKRYDGTHTDVVFTGATCALPVLDDVTGVEIGLFSGNIHTTVGASFECTKAITSGSSTPVAPTPSVYNQIIELIDEKTMPSGGTTGQVLAKASNADYDFNWQSGGTATVTRSSIETALGTDSPNLSANDYSNTEKASVTANTAARHTHDNKAVLDTITSGKTSAWDAKSTVSVSASGTATDEVQYITIDGVEKKLAGGGGSGTSDFDALTNRPKYNGSVMTHETSIPEVKTAAWDGKYAKPADGIPSTDMASAVQTSLGKANASVQGVQVAGSDLTPDENGKVNIPTPTMTVAGVIKVSDYVGTSIGSNGRLEANVRTLADYTAAGATQKMFIGKGTLDNIAPYIVKTKMASTTDPAWTDEEKTAARSRMGAAAASDIPTKTSDLTNDSGFLTEHQSLAAYRTAAEQDAIHDSTKQDVISDLSTIRSGAALGATALQEHQSLAAYRTSSAQDVIDTQLNQAIADKQDKLIAGTNITIAADGKTISATGGGGSVDYFTVQNGKVCAVYEGSV